MSAEDQDAEHWEELNRIVAERDTLRAEVERLNKWADGFSDAQLKERQTAEAYQRELRAEVAALRKDAERLDFMADNGVGCDRMPMGDTKFDVWRDGVRYTGKTPREAIDAALADKPLSGPTP